jgi:hypothetical protein
MRMSNTSNSALDQLAADPGLPGAQMLDGIDNGHAIVSRILPAPRIRLG